MGPAGFVTLDANERRTHAATFIFLALVFVASEFFVHRTLVLGSTCGKVEYAGFFLGDWGRACSLPRSSVVFLICADSIADHSDDFRGIQGLHCPPYVTSAGWLHIITCCGEPQCIVPCVQGSAREGLRKGESLTYLSPHLTFTKNRCIITKPCIVVRWKNCLENPVDLSFILGFRDDCILWLIWKWVLSPIAARTPPTFSFLWQPRMDIFSNGACELAFTKLYCV